MITLASLFAIFIVSGPTQFQAQAQDFSDAEAEISSGDVPVIPNFWDPKTVQDRPKDLPDKIQFLATDDFPPFVFRDDTGKLTGFNIDLARAICHELMSSCALKILPFEDLVPGLIAGEGDAIIAGLVPNTALNGDLAFTQDYLKLPGRFVVRADQADMFDETELAGRKIAVVAGTRHESFALSFWPDAFLQTYPTVANARQAVQEGEVDALFGSGLMLAIWMASEDAKDCCAFSGGPWLEPGFFDQGLGIAVRKSEPKLAEALDYALRKTATNGKYRELYLRYFPVSFY
ncbi:transporter substrate-binding domain-containing protein [Roseibium limicola]|uniref:transporter substrate-binding domain-containing protein n=1 Tax=Roseibium limicola TaxID=2816037 RepID=UPI001AD8AA07